MVKRYGECFAKQCELLNPLSGTFQKTHFEMEWVDL